MTKHNAANERIKREYFAYLVQAKGRDEATVDSVAKSLARFEESTRAKDFKRFHREQAVAFKARLAEAVNVRTGERLSKATMLSTLRDLKAFFFWLAHLPGFKSHIRYDDSDYFCLSDKDVAIARASHEKAVPSREQVAAVLAAMPAATVLERRDRALVAFTAITGARVGALASFRLGHVDLEGCFVEQDARTVNTKFAKTFRTYFMPVCDDALDLVRGWVKELRDDNLWGHSDPLFPATVMGLGENGGFQPKEERLQIAQGGMNGGLTTRLASLGIDCLAQPPLERHRLFMVKALEVSPSGRILEPRKRSCDPVNRRFVAPLGFLEVGQIFALDPLVHGVVFGHG